jgi:hypothetical protein
MIVTLLVVLLLLGLFGGIGYGYRPYRYHSWGFGTVVIILLIAWLLTGGHF